MPHDIRDVIMPTRIMLSDDDLEHIRMWQKLSPDGKEALNELGKTLSDDDKEASLYELIKLQTKISELLALVGHVKFFGRFLLKLAMYAGAITAIAGAIKVYWGKGS